MSGLYIVWLWRKNKHKGTFELIIKRNETRLFVLIDVHCIDVGSPNGVVG